MSHTFVGIINVNLFGAESIFRKKMRMSWHFLSFFQHYATLRLLRYLESLIVNHRGPFYHANLIRRMSIISIHGTGLVIHDYSRFGDWRLSSIEPGECILTHWGRDKKADISQTTFSFAYSWMKIYEFCLSCQLNLFQRFQLTIFQHWFR